MIKNCVICGKEFDAQGKDKTCSVACRKILKREQARQYRENKRTEYNPNWLQEYRKNNDLPEAKEDTLIGLGYAERQIAQTLKMVGKVKI